MILQHSELPKSKYLSDQILTEYSEKHSGKKIVTLVWSSKPGEITRQMEYAIDNDVDIILSEILPDELAFEINHEMYEFFLSKYIFVPPILYKADKSILTDRNKKNYIFTDSTMEREDRFSSIINNLKKTDFFEIIDISKLKECTTELNNYILEANHVIVNACSPQDLLAVLLISLTHSKRFTVLNESAYSPFRFSVFGININKFLPEKTSSLRSTIKGMLDSEKVEIEVLPDCFRKAIDLSTKPEFNSLHEIVQCEPFKTLDQLYKTRVNDILWKRPHLLAGLLKNKDHVHAKLNSDYNIFKRKGYHCLSKLLSKDNVEDNIRELYIKIESFVFKDHATELLNSRSNYLWHKEVLECVNLYPNWLTRVCDFAIHQTNNSVFQRSVLRNLEEFILWAMLSGADKSNIDIEREIHTNYEKIIDARIKIERDYKEVGVAKSKLLHNNEDDIKFFSDNESTNILELISTFDVITRSVDNDKNIIEALNSLSIQSIVYKYRIYERILASLLDRYHHNILSFAADEIHFGNGKYNNLIKIIEENYQDPTFPSYSRLIICLIKYKLGQEVDCNAQIKLKELYPTFYISTLLKFNPQVELENLILEIPAPTNGTILLTFYIHALITDNLIEANKLCKTIDKTYYDSKIIEDPFYFQNFFLIFQIVHSSLSNNTTKSNIFSNYSVLFDSYSEDIKNRISQTILEKLSPLKDIPIPNILEI